MLVIFLAVFAALVAGVNIRNRIDTPEQIPAEKLSDSPSPMQQSPTIKDTKDHEYKDCAVGFSIPDMFTLTNESSRSAILTRSDAKSSIMIACQKDIPRPPLPSGFIETIKLTNTDKTTTISAKLYHDQAPKDGEKIDALIYYNPKIKMDVFIAGYGSEFDALRSSLRLLP